MALHKKIKADLDKRYEKVMNTPVGFVLFAAIHDFIAHIEANPDLTSGLSERIKVNRDLGIPNKYSSLKQIYQGVEDVNTETTKDIGHTRYMVVRDLSRIQKNEISESNFFWKKREFFRKLTGEVYERLDSFCLESLNKK
jgi:hypothetical protein